MTDSEFEKRYFAMKEKGWTHGVTWTNICPCCVHSQRCPDCCSKNFKLASYETVLSRLNKLTYVANYYDKAIAVTKEIANVKW